MTAEPFTFDPAFRGGWVVVRLTHEIVTLGGAPTLEDAQRAAEADAGVPIAWVEPDLAYTGWSAAVRVPGEASARGYLIEHRLVVVPVTREARTYTKPSEAPSRQSAFLTAFADVGTINGASRRSKVPAASHYRWVSRDPRYARLFQEAQQRTEKRA